MRCVQQNMLPGRPHMRIICAARPVRLGAFGCACAAAAPYRGPCVWSRRTSLFESRSLIPASAWYRSYCSVGAVVAVPMFSVTQKCMKVLRRSWIWRILFIRHCASSLFLVARMSDLLIECESDAIELPPIEFNPLDSVRSECVVDECLSILEPSSGSFSSLCVASSVSPSNLRRGRKGNKSERRCLNRSQLAGAGRSSGLRK